MNQYCVYILASRSKRLYVGITNNLLRRIWEHRKGIGNGFAHRYKISKLVYYEQTSDVYSAISREKQIKGWLRSKKLELVESRNPFWQDLNANWDELKDTTTKRDSSLRSE